MVNLEMERFMKKLPIFLAVIIPLFIVFGVFIPIFPDGTTFFQGLFSQGAPDVVIQTPPEGSSSVEVTQGEEGEVMTTQPDTLFCRIYPDRC